MNNPQDRPQDKPQVTGPEVARPFPESATLPESPRPQVPADETGVDQPPLVEQSAATPPPYPPPAGRGRFRRFVGKHSVQLVAVGVLGMVLGGGIVGGAVALSGPDRHDGPRDRGGYSMHHQMQGGPGSFDGHRGHHG